MRKFVILTLAAILSGAVSVHAFDRELGDPRSVFIPKGTVAGGITCGYNNFDASGEDAGHGASLAGIITDVAGNVSLFNAQAHVHWFFKDNFAVGASIGYGNTSLDGDNLKLVAFDLSNKHARREVYSFSVSGKGYMPLFDSRMFALVFEGRMAGGFGYSKNYSETERGKEGSYSDIYSASLGLYGGVAVFLTNSLSVEFSVPFAGAAMDWEKQIQGQAHESSLSGGSFYFSPNFLGLGFSAIYHF
ncbi:MAG: hypothetical protein IJ799_06170 [Bacteroidales bacterium]|nr:hypothetical protein [Bacteroidales bacterium]